MAKYGRDIKLKFDGVQLLGTREKTLKYTGEAVDITDDYSNGYQELCEKDAVNAIELTVSGIEKDGFLKGRKNGGQLTGLLEIEGLDGVTQFNAVLQAVSFGLAYNDVVTYEATFKSTGIYSSGGGDGAILAWGLLVNDVGEGVVTQPQTYAADGFAYRNYAGEYPRYPASNHPKNNNLPMWFHIPDYTTNGPIQTLNQILLPIRSSSPYFSPGNIIIATADVYTSAVFYVKNYWQDAGEMYLVVNGSIDGYLPLDTYRVILTDNNNDPIAELSVLLGRSDIPIQ